MQTLITCPLGLSAVLNNELKKLHFKPFNTFETGTFVDTDWKGIYTINLHSRIANKVFLSLGAKEVKDFNQLFDFLQSLPWKTYLPTTANVSVQVVSKYSQLASEKSLQSVAHKAILTALGITHSDKEKKEKSDFEIFLHLESDVLRVYLNTSGDSLHKRGRRLQTGPAPIKENLAAALLILSGRRPKFPLIDPCCGSGTLLIEAALIAKNKAPGMGRTFAFQKFNTFESMLRNTVISEAKMQEFSNTYRIIGRDINSEVLAFAQKNSEKAGVSDCIQRELKDVMTASIPFDSPFWLISNPPYGKRLSAEEDLFPLYATLKEQIQSGFGGIVSSYPEMHTIFYTSEFSHKELYNGADAVQFYRKKFS